MYTARLTARQRAKLALPVLWAAVLALGNLACSVSYNYYVRNEAATPLLIADSHACAHADAKAIPDTDWRVIDPGNTQRLFSSGRAACVVVATMDRQRVATAEFRKDALYLVRIVTGEPSLEAIGGSSPENGDGITIFSIAVMTPFLIGMIGAAFVTLRFFYRYYVRHDKTARLE